VLRRGFFARGLPWPESPWSGAQEEDRLFEFRITGHYRIKDKEAVPTDHESPPPIHRSPSPMRTITYLSHEFHGVPEALNAELPAFVYDIPYFGACGIFPPFHIINGIFESGGAEGGMGPGATWKPFRIIEAEYEELVKAIEALDPKSLMKKVRFGQVKFAFDVELKTETEWETWMQKACDRHREAWHRKMVDK